MYILLTYTLYMHYICTIYTLYIGGDDMFYIIENLLNYLSSDEIIKAQQESEYGLFLGRRFFPPGQEGFNSGGAGYLLDRKALQLLMENVETPKCFPHQVGFWEDVNIANCLRKSSSNKLVAYDTRDQLQRERFHPFNPGMHLTYGMTHKDPKDWYIKYNPELKFGTLQCSSVLG